MAEVAKGRRGLSRYEIVMLLLALAALILGIVGPMTDLFTWSDVRTRAADMFDGVRFSIPAIGQADVTIGDLSATVRATTDSESARYPSCSAPMRCLYVVDMKNDAPLNVLDVDDIVVAVQDAAVCGSGSDDDDKDGMDAARIRVAAMPLQLSAARLAGLARGNILRDHLCATIIRSNKIVTRTITAKG